MRVMLIQPPMFHLEMNIAPNIGLAYIAAVLEQDGIDVRMVDAAAENFSFDEVIDRIWQFQPDIIGAGGQTPVSPRSLTLFERTKKEVSPDIVTLAGGPHFTFTDVESLEQCPALDIVVRGEGEATASHICKVIKTGGSLQEVDGITWRNQKGNIVRNSDREPIADIDSLPLPAWHLFPVDRYHWVGNPVLAITSSRGCPYKCPYCVTWKIHKGVRRRDPKKVVEEMVWVKKNFKHDTFFFQDDASFLVREQMEGFLDALESCGEELYWYYETREDVFLKYRELWPRMRKNGMFKIVFGLETPDPKMRKCCGKEGFDCQAVENMLDTLENEFDIMVSIYLLFGMPGDTVETMEENVKYGKKLYPKHCSFIVGSMAVPFPGTDMYIDLEKKDMIISRDWNDYGFGKSVIKTDIPSEKMSQIFSDFWVGAYVRPSVFYKQIKYFLSRNRFRRSMAKQYVKMAIEMIGDVKKMKKEKKEGF